MRDDYKEMLEEAQKELSGCSEEWIAHLKGKKNNEETMERVRYHTIKALKSYIEQGYIPPVDLDEIKVVPKDNDPTTLTIHFPKEIAEMIERL